MPEATESLKETLVESVMETLVAELGVTEV